jgi:hypothetical protein
MSTATPVSTAASNATPVSTAASTATPVSTDVSTATAYVPTATPAAIETVKGNERLYSKREVEAATRFKKFSAAMGHLSQESELDLWARSSSGPRQVS